MKRHCASTIRNGDNLGRFTINNISFEDHVLKNHPTVHEAVNVGKASKCTGYRLRLLICRGCYNRGIGEIKPVDGGTSAVKLAHTGDGVGYGLYLCLFLAGCKGKGGNARVGY